MDFGAEEGARRVYRCGTDGGKMVAMAGCLPNTKRFRHGRPDRGRSRHNLSL